MGFGWVLQPSGSLSMPTRLPMASRVRSACKSIGNVDGVGGLVGLAAISTKPAPAPPPPQQQTQQQQQPERRVAITRCVTPERFLGAGIAHRTAWIQIHAGMRLPAPALRFLITISRIGKKSSDDLPARPSYSRTRCFCCGGFVRLDCRLSQTGQ